MRYVRGDVIDQLFARIEEDAGGDIPYWYLTDHLGSIRDVIDGSAVVKDSITYDGFGNITAQTDSNYRGRYAWTGREIDVEIELQYNRARYYDGTTGRWIAIDREHAYVVWLGRGHDCVSERGREGTRPDIAQHHDQLR